MIEIKEESHSIADYMLEVVRLTPDTASHANSPILLLHEGLGSVSMWKSFPARLAETTERQVIAYSRAGYGKSSAARLPREIDYMHDEGLLILPELIQSLGIYRPVLLGHSDGASIALICAGSTQSSLCGLILMAPHIFVEPISINSIKDAKENWEQGDLGERLGKYHDDVKSAFFGWNDIWLKDEFLQWNIASYLQEIKIPILTVQGIEDEYGTMAQIDAIKDKLPHTEILKLPNCGHSPHIDQPEILLNSIKKFLSRID